MIQLKCCECGMVTNIKEVTFSRVAKLQSADNYTVCLSCGNKLTDDVIKLLKTIIESNLTSTWLVGTCFEQSSTG